MPSRIVREGIIDSRAVNSLTEQGEIFYRRLMSVVDDYGRFTADSEILRARCFPLQLDRWPLSRVSEALSDVSAVRTDDGQELVTVYLIGHKKYLQINNFQQRVRSDSRFPPPCDGQVTDSCLTDDGHMTASRASRARSEALCAMRYSESESNAKADAVPAVVREMLRPAEESTSPPSPQFSAWWALWSGIRGTNHRPQAESAYFRRVTVANEDACFECTGSYLESLENPGKGYNPENFLEEQARDQFRARWPARDSPGAGAKGKSRMDLMREVVLGEATT